jgi:hypothetical protein
LSSSLPCRCFTSSPRTRDSAKRRRRLLYPIVIKKERYDHLPLTISFILYSIICLELVQLVQILILSAFRPRGVPGPTSELSPRAPAQMGRRETERKGGKPEGDRRKRGNPRPSCLSRAQVGCACSRGYKRPRGREREAYARRPVPPRGQPFVRVPWAFLL